MRGIATALKQFHYFLQSQQNLLPVTTKSKTVWIKTCFVATGSNGAAHFYLKQVAMGRYVSSRNAE